MIAKAQDRFASLESLPIVNGPGEAIAGLPEEAPWAIYCRRFAASCSLAALAFSVLALLGWLSGLQILAGRFGETVPMAPATALGFLLLGSALAIQVRARLSRRGRAYVLASAALMTLAGVIRLTEWAAGNRVGSLEQRVFGNWGGIGDVPVGSISPITALGFLITGLALLLLVWSGSGPLRRLGQTLPLLVIAIHIWVLWGYLKLPDAQVLQSESRLIELVQIPVAVPTALSFLAVALGLIVAEGPQHFLFRHLVGDSARAQLLRAFLPPAVALVIVSTVLGGILTFTLPFDASVTLLTLWTLAAPVLVSLLLSKIAFLLGGALDRAEAERVRALDLRHARDAAEAANRAKDMFIATVSHELRTPLNHIHGFCQLLGLTPLDDHQRSDLEKIRAAGGHLLHLINDILDYQKIIMGHMPLEPEEFDLAPWIQETAELMDAKVQKKGNRLEMALGDNLGRVWTDRNRLRQVLVNLLSNAAKFTEKGTIAVDVRREQEEEGDWIWMSVADTGKGMSPDQLARLFKPFGKLTAKGDNPEGTGLGLAITKNLCRLLGGDVSAVSELGKGTTLTVRLPVTLPKETGPFVKGQLDTESAQVPQGAAHSAGDNQGEAG